MKQGVGLGLIHFKTCGVEHLRRALASVAAQDLTRVTDIVVYDNDSGTEPPAIQAAIEELLPEAGVIHDLHGDPAKTHPYSVNRTIQWVRGPLVAITRSDYILAPGALRALIDKVDHLLEFGKKPFVTGWCYQVAYDRQEQPYPDHGDLTGKSFDDLLALPGHIFHETDQDAGVFLTLKAYWEACPLNEQLSAWGYAQSTWQRQLANEQGVTMHAIPQELFVHQQHGTWDRDHALARQQYEQFGGGR